MNARVSNGRRVGNERGVFQDKDVFECDFFFFCLQIRQFTHFRTYIYICQFLHFAGGGSSLNILSAFFLNEQKSAENEMPNRKLKQNVKYLTLYCMWYVAHIRISIYNIFLLVSCACQSGVCSF